MFSFQVSWLRCTMALSSFRSVVDDEAGTRVGPKGVCSPCTAAFTVLNSCRRQRTIWSYWIGATFWCLWFARLDPLCALLCVRGKVVFSCTLFSLDLFYVFSFSLDGAVHLVPFVAMPYVAFCLRAISSANSSLIRRDSALCWTREVPFEALSVDKTDKSGLVFYYLFS